MCVGSLVLSHYNMLHTVCVFLFPSVSNYDPIHKVYRAILVLMMTMMMPMPIHKHIHAFLMLHVIDAAILGNKWCCTIAQKYVAACDSIMMKMRVLLFVA